MIFRHAASPRSFALPQWLGRPLPTPNAPGSGTVAMSGASRTGIEFIVEILHSTERKHLIYVLNLHWMKSFHINYRLGLGGESHWLFGSLRHHGARWEWRRSASTGPDTSAKADPGPSASVRPAGERGNRRGRPRR